MKAFLKTRILPGILLFVTVLVCGAATCNRSGSSRSGGGGSKSGGQEVEWWLTKGDGSVLFQKQDVLPFTTAADSGLATITIDEGQVFQTMDGFGFTLTGGSAEHLLGMGQAERTALLRELFHFDGNNIGISYLRLSIGASDLSSTVFSYNDLPAGQTDPQMTKFDLGPDKKTVIPILKEILAINPQIKLMGSPWSPPTWMKTNGDTRGGSLKPEWYDAYARYFVKYIQEMAKEGIRIDAITVQNEPLHPGNNPSLLMLPEEQAAFIKQSLGPIFRSNNIDTKIIIYDHNADRPDYPITILNDPEAKQYIDGSAFHLYGGQIDALQQVHNAHPDKHLYFTEQWIGAPGNFPENLKWHTANLTIGATRNWCRTVLEWNLTNNPSLTPYTDRGGCSKCLGAVTIDGNKITRNPAYYIIAHASKFVRPGAQRIFSNSNPSLPNVAFKTTDGKTVLIVLNNSNSPQNFQVKSGNQTFTTNLDGGAVATYVW
jgi:glucosylceramidase